MYKQCKPPWGEIFFRGATPSGPVSCSQTEQDCTIFIRGVRFRPLCLLLVCKILMVHKLSCILLLDYLMVKITANNAQELITPLKMTVLKFYLSGRPVWYPYVDKMVTRQFHIKFDWYWQLISVHLRDQGDRDSVWSKMTRNTKS